MSIPLLSNIPFGAGVGNVPSATTSGLSSGSNIPSAGPSGLSSAPIVQQPTSISNINPLGSLADQIMPFIGSSTTGTKGNITFPSVNMSDISSGDVRGTSGKPMESDSQSFSPLLILAAIFGVVFIAKGA